MSPGVSIFVVVVILVVGWFALGTHINVRKGHRYMEWLQGGLPLLGEKTTLRWLGSSVVQLKIDKAHAPFRRAEVLVVLEPRDVPPLWLLSRWQGRRDLLIVRTEMRAIPQLQVEVLDHNSWSAQAIIREVKSLNWRLQSHADDHPLRAYSPAPNANIEHLSLEASRCELPLVRLGVRESNNALEMQWRLPATPTCAARAVIETVQRVAEMV